MRRAIEDGLADIGHSIEIGLRGQLYDATGWTMLSGELGLDYVPCTTLLRDGVDAVTARIRERAGDRRAFRLERS